MTAPRPAPNTQSGVARQAPPPPPPAPAPRPLNPTPPSSPQEDFFVRKPVAPAPVFSEPVARPAPAQESWVKPVLAVIALLVGAFGGFWAIRALRSNDPVLNLGADGEVATLKANSAFVPLRGYGYQRLPGGMEDQVNQMIAAVPEAKDQVLGLGMRGVTRGGQMVGVVTVAAVTPETILSRGERASVFDGIEEAGGTEAEKLELGGLEVYTVDVPTGNPVLPTAHGVVYFYENLFVVVIGFDGTTAQDVTSQLIEGAQ